MSHWFVRTVKVMPILVVAALAATACTSTGSADPAATTPAGTAAPFFDKLPDDIKQKGVLTWVGDIQSPLRMQASSGAPLTGVQPDFAAAMEKLLGVKIEQPIVATFADVIPSIQSGRYDVGWGGLSVTPERERTFDVITWTFSVPTFVYPPTKSYSTPADLCGLQLAHVAGSAPFDAAFASLTTYCAQQSKPAPKAFELGSRADLQVALTGGRVDAYFTTPVDAAYASQLAPEKFKFVVLKDAPFRPTPLAAEMKKGNDKLRDAMYSAMQQLWKDGTYETIMKKWNMQALQIPAPLLNPLSSAAGASPAPSASS